MRKLNSGTKKATKSVESGFKRAGNAIKKFKGQIIAAAAAIFVMVKSIGSVVIAFKKQEQAVARLTQALKNQNNFTIKNIDALIGQAKALQKVTQFGDEQIISGQAMLASFALSTEQIQALTPAMLDLAIMTQKTTGSQSDLESIAKLVGVALGGQAGRLVQMGIKLTEVEKKELNLANATEKVNVLLRIFENNAGGLAQAVGETATASIDKFSNSFGDLKEVIGKAVMPTLGRFLVGLTKVVGKLIDYFSATDKEIDFDKIIPTDAELDRLARLGKLSDEVVKTLKRERKEGTLLVPQTKELINARKEMAFLSGESVGVKKEELDLLIDEQTKLISVTDAFKVQNSLLADNELLRKNLITRIIIEGDVTGELQTRLDEANKEYVILKGSVNDITNSYTLLNEQLDLNLDKTKKTSAQTFIENENKKKLLESTLALIDQFDREAAIDEKRAAGIKATKEERDALVTQLEDLKNGTANLTTEEDILNKEIGVNFIKAVDSSQVSRTKLITDLGNIKQVLVDTQIELKNLNDTQLEDKSASYTINITEIITRVFE